MAAEVTFEKLKKEYSNFTNPVVLVEVEGNPLNKSKAKLYVGNIEIENTSGFEASIASFVIYGCYNRQNCAFEFKSIKKFVAIGSQVSISVGYGSVAKEVFCGFISQVNFFFQEDENPGVRVTCMDVKGIMMANCYSKQMTAMSYSDAVNEIFSSELYSGMKERGIIKKLSITDTPDKQSLSGGALGGVGDAAGVASSVGGAVPGVGGASVPGLGGSSGSATDKTVEMVAESDYEFVVKAAKKYNYEFFVSSGIVYFRKAKNYAQVLMEVSPATGMKNVDVEYNVTGLVGEVEVRSTDVGKAEQIKNSVKLKNKLSKGKYASKLVKESSKVYIDPTADSKAEAGYRAEYLAEDVAFRFGTMEAEFIGIPDLVPGRYIKLVDMGDPVNNLFYITSVRHTMNAEQGFSTRISAKAAGLGGSYSAGSSGGGLLGGALGGVMDAANQAMDAVDSAMDAVDGALDDLNDMTGGVAGDIVSAGTSGLIL
ncbi:MAG: hypothetical protein SPG09_12430 [Lachnospiraceae bacterium]|nr:hypothetical protein [bacterium]MDY5518394.1 hypothetical protein [Lachnospiraceae bacterium]